MCTPPPPPLGNGNFYPCISSVIGKVQTDYGIIVQLLSTKIVHFYHKSMELCQITTNPKTNIFGYGAKPNSTLDTSTAQALKWPT